MSINIERRRTAKHTTVQVEAFPWRHKTPSSVVLLKPLVSTGSLFRHGLTL